MLRIPVTDAKPPEGLRRVEVTVNTAGQERKRTFDAAPNQTWAYEWDGRDGFGRALSGVAKTRVDVNYVYASYRQQAIDEAVAERRDRPQRAQPVREDHLAAALPGPRQGHRRVDRQDA